MPRTARRRWSREFTGEIDGIALGETGPVFVHGYDAPAGGKWVDSVIPGKMGAYDRSTGEELWLSPCEVGYGRGFAAGLGDEDDLIVLGPGNHGHRIARMSAGTGELLGMGEIRAFDEGLVFGDMSVTVTPDRINGIMTGPMLEVWSYLRDGERYHLAGRSGPSLLVVFTDLSKKRQGVQRLDIESGDAAGELLPAEYAVIHDMVTSEGLLILLVSDRVPTRNRPTSSPEELRLEAWRVGESEAHPLWRSPVDNESTDDLPEVSIFLDCDKLYVASSALMEVRDGLTGRPLGEWTVPGLDERVGWTVSQGAGLLAEETRASIFELPA